MVMLIDADRLPLYFQFRFSFPYDTMAAGVSLQVLLNVRQPVADEPANADETGPAPLPPPSAQRRLRASEHFCHFLFVEYLHGVLPLCAGPILGLLVQVPCVIRQRLRTPPPCFPV